METTEFAGPGVIYDEGGLKITAFGVDHGEAIKPAFGVRAEYGGHTAVISGDTRFSENLIANAEGADLLIREVGTARPELLEQDHARRVIAHHTGRSQSAQSCCSIRCGAFDAGRRELSFTHAANDARHHMPVPAHRLP